VIDVILSHKSRLSSEAIHWDHLVTVVAFKNTSYSPGGMFVLIVASYVVERVTIVWVSIGACVVNSQTKRDGPPIIDIGQEIWLLLDAKVDLNQCPCILSIFSFNSEFVFDIKLSKSNLNFANRNWISIIAIHELEFYLTIRIRVAYLLAS